MAERQAEFLRMEGVFSKGFGIIPKLIMHDSDLSLESKAIYAYLCALAGSGTITFPYRDTILRHLKMAKNTYYKHYTPLIEQGYLRVDKPDNRKDANIYTLVSNPKKLEDIPKNENHNGDMLRYKGIKSHGYGILPRSVMYDTTLSVKAKGLYAYLCSYCGAGDCAFPRRDNILLHLNISEPTYYKALNQLKQTGLLEVVQSKAQGRFGVCDYFLREADKQNMPDIKPAASPIESPAPTLSPYPNICDTKKCDNKNWYTKNDDPNIITVSFSNNISSNNLSIAGTSSDGTGQTDKKSDGFDLESSARKWSVGILPDNAEGVAMLKRFLPVFAERLQGRSVKNLSAYFRASLKAYVEEWRVKTSLDGMGAVFNTAGYNLAQLEAVIEREDISSGTMNY